MHSGNYLHKLRDKQTLENPIPGQSSLDFSEMMRGRSVFRSLLLRRSFSIRSISSQSTPGGAATSIPKSNHPITAPPSVSAAQNLHFSSRFALAQFQRSVHSNSPKNVVRIDTEEELHNALTKAQGESLPAVFYFTAQWCGPCRVISPMFDELMEKYPHVTAYKLDIDSKDIQGTLGKLNITAVPTFHFFHNGKKDTEIIGAELDKLNATAEKLYKKD